MATNQGFASLVPNDRRSTWFLYYWIQQNRSKLVSLAAGSTFLEISGAAVGEVELFAPGLAEQDRIGDALKDADNTIDLLEHAIAKKQAIKQAMMQQLLTGRTRLPGFGGAWDWCPFDRVMRRVAVKKHQIPASSYRDVGRLPVVDQGQMPIVGYTDEMWAKFDPGDDGVIVFGDHTCNAKFVNFPFAVGADGTQILQALPGHSTRFLAYALEVDPVPSRGYNRHFKVLREKRFPAPALTEQRAVSAALLDADDEVHLLQRRLKKAKEIKRGMMQELLSGRTRLPELKAAA